MCGEGGIEAKKPARSITCGVLEEILEKGTSTQEDRVLDVPDGK